MHESPIIVLDFGSQYTQIIARRIRELRVYSEIWPFNVDPERLAALRPAGLVLSGGPASCYEAEAPLIERSLLQLGVPVLGICYGFQLITRLLGGGVSPGQAREYGRARIRLSAADCPLWHGLDADAEHAVWMSHGDRVERLPPGWRLAAASDNAPIAAAWDPEARLFGVQFHPEVAHTPDGIQMLASFVFHACGCQPRWTMASFVETQVERIGRQVGPQARLICGLSGGVDSTVAAALVHRAVGDRLTCVFVDNGLLRAGEAAQVREVFGERFAMPLVAVDARRRFLSALAGISDPEQKRRVIGGEFIAVFEEEARRLAARGGPVDYLVQGTLYPDVIESVSFKGPSATIKSHHNVGGLPEKMSLELVEPLRELFKDEVRRVGEELGVPRELIWRQPFPGPGLAVRLLGPIDEERLEILRQADRIIEEEVRAAGLYEAVWQSFGVLLPVRSVGVMGDCRTYESALALRAVTSTDGMTADWARLPYELLAAISSRVINEVPGINRVVYDISSKPPATIEWE